MPYLLIIVLYSAIQVALGLWIARRVRGTGDFFVAGRQLGPGLLFATLLAPNIGVGSTVGAAGLGYQNGLAAWWWVGSAGIGSAVLALWVGPRIWRVAAAHDLRTVGDFLEWRYDARVRAIMAVLLWIGTVAILAGQLIGIAWILEVVTGAPKFVGCALGGVLVIVYFAAGGLVSSAAVNVVQLTVKMVGFFVALPIVIGAAGGMTAMHDGLADPALWNAWQNGTSGWMYAALLAPNFIVSPGLVQKVYGARDERTVRVGVGLNAVALFAYALIPALMGMAARVLHPELANRELALPLLFMHDVPFAIGALGLAAVFSAEVSAADATLFMLATSLSKDLYKRFVRPDANDAQVLFSARAAAVCGGVFAIAVAFVSKTIIDALSLFYTIVGVSLFVPLIAGLYVRRARASDALTAIGGGLIAFVGGEMSGRADGLTPPMLGVIAAAAAFTLSVLVSRTSTKVAHYEDSRTRN